VYSQHFLRKLCYHENTKVKKNFVISNFRVFVMNPFGLQLAQLRVLKKKLFIASMEG
jgi:hypothetical protein